MNIHSLYRPFLHSFRRRRMKRFSQEFSIGAETRVLDVGGSDFNWQFVPEKPRLTLLNLSGPPHQPHWVVADGRYLPFAGKSFDVVYSNSVVEHLGTYENQALFAAECRRVGKRYYVQTPNRGFPVEPHLITPFVHWLPRTWQRRLLRNLTVWGLIVPAGGPPSGLSGDARSFPGGNHMARTIPGVD